MPNQIGLAGGQPQKQTRFAPIYTGRFYSGLWTNRSPLRDAASNRLVEKFYGPAGDAIISGTNVEITNKLTLARRPGNTVFDSTNNYTNVDAFSEFRMFGPTQEQILVMIDEANTLYAYNGSTRQSVWTKSTGAGQSYMQSVGNSLYFGNGVDNKKWLQSLFSWSSAAQWNTATTPYFNTFFIDPNGNIQQLTGCALTVTQIQIVSNVLTVTCDRTITSIISKSLKVKFPAIMSASFLENQTVTVTAVSGSTFTASFTHANYGPSAESSILATVVSGGTPISGSVQPTWSTTPLTPGMATPGLAVTLDGTVQWTNRGTSVQNWGINPPSETLTATIGSSRSAWRKSTFFSYPGVIIDSNGNLQQVTTSGISGGTAPTWATVVGNTTTDGSVVWTMIQTAASMVWAAHTTYAAGSFIIGNASGTNCLFKLSDLSAPYIKATYGANVWLTGDSDQFRKTYPAPAPDFTLSGLSSIWSPSTKDGSNNQVYNDVNGAGEVVGTITTGHHSQMSYALMPTITIRVPGQYSFNVVHDNAAFLAFGDGAQKVSGIFSDPRNLISPQQTAVLGFNQLVGDNSGNAGSFSCVWNFPVAGDYRLEVDWTGNQGANDVIVTCNGNTLCVGNESGTTQPIWPIWSTIYAPNYPNVSEAAGQYKWINLGPTADFTWSANITYTLPNTTIIDANANTEAPYRTGVTGVTEPTWATGLNQLTNDNPNLIWINQGAASAPAPGTVSTFNGGWQYAISLVNTLDDTVSNCGTLSMSTGNFVAADGISLAPGAGLPDSSLIDPQADYVAIFRTTDGGSIPVLIPGTGQTIYTISLADYLANGYTDTTPDTELDSLLSGPISGENTPPGGGAINLVYHLNRIFYSIGNTVYWTSGPFAPIGNGVNGTAPLNFDVFPSLVKRIVPCSLGALVFTVSDIYLITGQGTASSPIQSGQPFLKGIGLLSYNALDINGSIIGLYTTDKQFIILDPTSGVSYAGFPIGDLLRQNNGSAGTSWNPSNVYVTWHVDGEDAAWYLSDGQFGWYRLMATPAPETGYTWSPFANIIGGCKAVQSVETSPGTHKLLLGPTGTGKVLYRDLTSFSDNGTAYPANVTMGSIVLAQPGQIASISFIATDSVNIGTPLWIGVIVDEALPYYKGGFEYLREYENDPVNQPKSTSILGQRFYLHSLEENAPICRHLQVQIGWDTQSAANELLTFTIFGAYYQEN